MIIKAAVCVAATSLVAIVFRYVKQQWEIMMAEEKYMPKSNYGTPDLHKHKCTKCGTVWEHFLTQIPISEYDKAHACPKCGTDERWHHSNDEPALFCHNGERTIDYSVTSCIITRAMRAGDSPHAIAIVDLENTA